MLAKGSCMRPAFSSRGRDLRGMCNSAARLSALSLGLQASGLEFSVQGLRLWGSAQRWRSWPRAGPQCHKGWQRPCALCPCIPLHRRSWPCAGFAGGCGTGGTVRCHTSGSVRLRLADTPRAIKFDSGPRTHRERSSLIQARGHGTHKTCMWNTQGLQVEHTRPAGGAHKACRWSTQGLQVEHTRPAGGTHKACRWNTSFQKCIKHAFVYTHVEIGVVLEGRGRDVA
eukprot:358236-Chlamydomonas_euryale.AAC.1